jgi:hypothetical protein
VELGSAAGRSRVCKQGGLELARREVQGEEVVLNSGRSHAGGGNQQWAPDKIKG